MKKYFLAAITVGLFAATGAAVATPKKAGAEAWVQEFRNLKDKSTDALVLRDAVGSARAAMRSKLTQVESKAKQVFGNDSKFSSCGSAAQRLVMLFDATFEARDGNHVALSGVARSGLEAGQLWGECRNAVDQLK